jgi:polyhydroxyalkanoate synthase subunit PhaC
MTFKDSHEETDLGYKNATYLHMDRFVNAMLGSMTRGIAPLTIIDAFNDWRLHLMKSPGKQQELREEALRKFIDLMYYASKVSTDPKNPGVAEPTSFDYRFHNEEWQQWPYNIIHQSFLLFEEWLKEATTEVRGVTQHHEDIVSFTARQFWDMYSPSNFIMTNPVILKATVSSAGMNLVKGWQNLLEDMEHSYRGLPPVGTEKYVVGETIAVSPGKVVFRNHLMELIQYTPTTKTVHPEPILIMPAWIMKYYILDLSPENSLVKYLVDNGYTVFIISWRNLQPKDRDVRMLDYREKGMMAALDTIKAICPGQEIHGVGYCLGGTLLSIGAAHMARDNFNCLKTITFLAAQVDFEEAGELTLFIDENQVTFLEDIMWEQGVLDSKQLAGAFQILRSNDLIWSRMVHNYLLGKRDEMYDLMAWNADATRLPFKMHSQYLRQLFLDNDLAEGRYPVGDRPVVLSDIRTPIFCVATTKDHISPWRSVYKLNLLTNSGLTFLLTSGGHNVGIISVNHNIKHSYQVDTKAHDSPYIDPDQWIAETPVKEGSWWPEWLEWLNAHSGTRRAPPPMGLPDRKPLMDAPGSYVLEK